MKKYDLYELTNPQKSIWMTEKFYEGSNINNICATLTIKEDANLDILEKAINECIQKNKGLRTKIKTEDGVAKQYFDELPYIEFERYYLKNKITVRKLAEEVMKESFDVEDNVLFKFKLFKLENGHGGLIFNIHHIIADAATLSVMAKDVIEDYYKIKNSEKVESKDYSYEDYIKQEQEYLKSEKFIKDEQYWNDMYQTIPEIATIPSISESGKREDMLNASREKFVIDKKTLEKIVNYCKTQRISNFNFFMAIYAIYLGRVANLNDFAIGTPILNRTNFKEKNMTGMFISTAPLRIKIEDNISFKDFVREISQSSLNMLRYQRYPYQMLLEDLRKKDSSIPSLYDFLLSYQVTKAKDKTLETPYDVEWIPTNTINNSMYVHLHDNDDNGTLEVDYDYQVNKYSKKDIKNIHNRILYMIEQVIEDEQILEKDIEIVTEEEKNVILNDFNNTILDYPRNETVVDLFEEQVKKTPDNIAVICGDDKLTYSELNEKANSLARYLVENGIKANDIVGVLLHRSVEVIISILAVLKSGAAYIPMDPEYPAERISYMLEDSKCKLILSEPIIYSKLKLKNVKIVDVAQNNEKIYKKNKRNLNIEINEENLSYIIYTSGSTGKPKGVMLKHKGITNLINYCNNYVEYLRNNKYRNIVSITTISFDIFFFESIISLQRGLKVVIANEEEQTIPRLLEKLIEDQNIEIIQTTPSRMKLFIENVSDKEIVKKLKYITLAGEQYPISLANELKRLGAKVLYNGYGPSETTVFSTLTDVTKVETMTIGKPLSNTQIYIVDKNSKLLPIGIPGEICISGDGVGKGYINKKELTEKSFVDNPFNKESLLYRTGDLGYYNQDGTITCLGRVDNQIKIRGLRIELEEIEKVIVKIKEIDNCVVAKKTNKDGHEFLCAYYVKNAPIEVKNIRKSIEKVLTKYMVPQYFIEIDKIPYTPNGKIDRKSLPLPSTENTKREIVEPESDEEKLLKRLFEKVLHMKEISIEDNFFEIGGDSLSAIKLSAQIYEKMQVQIGIKLIFDNPTIRELAKVISSIDKTSETDDIAKVENRKFYPVSSAQKRIYYASLMDKDSTVYNISGGLMLNGVPDYEKLNNCFKKLVERNESLRTYFEVQDGELIQKIKKNIDFNIERETTVKSDIEEITSEFVRPFDLSKAPLIRAKIVELPGKKSILIIDLHHIVGDGATLEILTKQLSALYNDDKIKDKVIDYKDFSIWENNNYGSKKYKAAEKFWVSKFEGDIPVLELPVDYTRPAIQSYEGSEIVEILDNYITEKINRICVENNVTPFMLLISVYYILLHVYARTDDIVVGVPISGRYNKKLLDVVGMFVNTLPMRVKIDINDTFEEYLNKIKNEALESFDYQNYPLDELIKKLSIPRDTTRNPLFDVIFTYQNNSYPKMQFNNITANYYIPKTKISKFDLTMEVIPEEEHFKLRFEYCTKLFSESYIQNFSKHYINALNYVLNNIDTKISDIEILSKSEKNKILYQFNNTKVKYPEKKNVVELFEKQVLYNPTKVALVFEEQKLTYFQLNKKANQVANYLKNEYGIKEKDVIAIFMDKSVESIIAILAIIKLGGVFVPIDVEYPEERIQYILEDSNAKAVLTKQDVADRITEDIPKIDIDLSNKLYEEAESKNINQRIKSDDLIYMMYTSGSTGKPKGVMITHKNVVRLVKKTNYIRFTSNERILQTGSIVFDACTFEIWGALLNGGTLHLMQKQNMLDQNYFEKYLKENKITSIFLTTALFNQYCEASETIFSSLNNLLTGGEAVSIKHMKIALKNFPKLNLVHVYGPTENTTFSTYYNVKKKVDNVIPIGKAIANSTTYVVSKEGCLLPTGVPGELWVGGDGVGKGYLNREDLNKEKFIDNPFGKGRVYKTGDLVKLLEDGNIEFIGRIDNQVKIRGFRIELNEIDNVIQEYPYVSKTYTIIKLIDDKQYIVTYYTVDRTINSEDINNYLQDKLPFYMIPQFLIQLKDFPLTVNGKVDKSKLPDPKLKNLQKYVAPENDTQRQLCEIWKKLFEMKKVSILDNFFELGGDSLTAIKLQTEALKYNININYSDVFEYPTIKSLSEKKQDEQLYKVDQNYDYSEINKLLSYNNINNIIDDDKIQKDYKCDNILLCGSTGFLGAHILDKILTKTKANVYCVVRRKENVDSVTRLKNVLKFYFGSKYENSFGKRIKVVYGDITVEKFGLNDNEYEELGQNIDVIINSAAMVKHFGDFEMFNSINVIGTRNIIEFCKKFNKKLYHISTMSVAGINTPDEIINNDEERIIYSEDNFYVGQNLNNAYVYTKFEAEKEILEEIPNGLDACILRMGNISNRVSDGKFQMNVSENAFINRIKSILNIKVIQSRFLNHAIEFTPVDSSAEAIVKIMLNNCKFSVLHLFNTKVISFPDIIAIMKSLNYEIDVVDDKKFAEKINEFLRDDELKSKISGLIPDLNKNKTLALLSKTLPNGYFTTAYLKSIGFEWPEIDKNYIEKYINYFRKIKYIE